MRRRPSRKFLLVPALYLALVAFAALPVACATATQEHGGDPNETSSSSSSSSGHPFPVGVGVGVGSGSSSAGGVGGASGAGGASSAQSSSSSQQASSSQSSGPSSSASSSGPPPPPCDNTGVCQTCVNCAVDIGGPCEVEYDICFLLNPDCAALVDCLNLCDPADPAYQTCIDSCAAMYQAGIPDYNALGQCAICDNCFNDCDGANSGC